MLAYQCQPVFTIVPWHCKILTTEETGYGIYGTSFIFATFLQFLKYSKKKFIYKERYVKLFYK